MNSDHCTQCGQDVDPRCACPRGRADAAERDEWFALRDAALAQNPGMEPADVFKGLSLTLWRICKQQAAAIDAYLRECEK